MMKIPVIKLGKIFINSIFPFFEKSKALELIKNDMLEVTDDLLAKLYDKVKPIFVKDDRKSILEQLSQKPEDKVWQSAASVSISEELENNKQFLSEITEYVNELEKSYPFEKINEIYNIKGKKNKIKQGQHSTDKTKNTIDGVDGDENTIIQG